MHKEQFLEDKEKKYMSKILVELRYKEICAIKHALDKSLRKKKEEVFEVREYQRHKVLKDIIDEEKLSGQLENIIQEHRY